MKGTASRHGGYNTPSAVTPRRTPPRWMKHFSLDAARTALYIAFFLSVAFLIDVRHYRLKLLALESGALIFLAAVLFNATIKAKIMWRKNVLDKWVLFYFLYVLARYLVFGDKNIARMEMEKNLLCAGLFFGAGQFILPSETSSIRKIFSVTALLVAIYGLWQNFGTPIGAMRVPKISPPYATFGNQNFFAAYLVIALPFVLALFGDKKLLWKIFAAAALAVFALDFYYINSRGGYVGAFTGIAVYMFVIYRKKIPRIKTIILALCVVAATGGYMTRAFWMRDMGRLLIWRDTLVMAVKNPLGVGPGAFAVSFPNYASEELKKIYPQKKNIVNFAHNEYLEIFAELGLPGIILFLMIVVTFFRNVTSPCYTAAAAGILANNLFSVNMRFIITAAMLYFIFALFRSENSKNKEISFGGNYFERLLPVLAAAVMLGFFIPKMLMPFRALKATSAEPDFHEAVEDGKIIALNASLAENPENYDTLYNLGWLYAKEKKWQKAADAFIKAVKIRPTPGLWNNIGNIFFETGNRPKAIEAYKNALSLNPEMVDSHFNLGYTYFYEGRLKDAAAEFREVLKRDKNNAKAIVMMEKMKE
ncbi:tetratricopeptide repeat protein [bacterium]|nr:tetratricopeptide repeat protein [bacterium]